MKTGHAYRIAAALLAIPLLLSGCSQRPAAEPEKETIRILFSNEQSFQLVYGDYFAVKFPHLEVEIVPTDGEFTPDKNYLDEYERLIRERKPDLVIAYDASLYKRWADNGLLADLEPFARKAKFDLNAFFPAAIEQLKMNNEGKLFGLAPEFTSSALYYNKTLFDRYGVPYPTNRMTWEEVFELAQRFPIDPDPEKRIYGIHKKYWTPFDFVEEIASTEGASYASADGKRMTIDADVWRRAFNRVVAGFRSGNLYYYYKDGQPIRYGPEETKAMDLFSTGRAAMMISTTEQMFRMKQWGTGGFDWDVVTVPVDPANPEYTRYFNVAPIYAIPANAEHAAAAWKVVEYFNSEEAARISLKTSETLSTRTAFTTTKDGHSLEPFYMLKRKEESYPTLPAAFYEPFQELVIREIDEAVRGLQSADEAVRAIQTEGQSLLDEAWTKSPPPPD
jgi:multiple sugar transport system substrate-binding protein